jgi:hypothetical protein
MPSPNLSPPLDACDSPEQRARYHVLGLQVLGSISSKALGWLQSTEIKFLKWYYYNISVCVIKPYLDSVLGHFKLFRNYPDISSNL